MPDKPVTIPNPMPLILNLELQGDRTLHEALFLTFNVDLGYFEARLLGVCQAAGARATVIADASVWDPDPIAVRSAGIRYHAGLAQANGAFHEADFAG